VEGRPSRHFTSPLRSCSAATVFALAYDHRGYAIESRHLAGVLVWAALVFGSLSATSKQARVVVQQRTASRWKTLAVLTSDRYGIFQRTFAATHRGYVRARLAGTKTPASPSR
jgi:hypothetical protein